MRLDVERQSEYSSRVNGKREGRCIASEYCSRYELCNMSMICRDWQMERAVSYVL